MLFVGGSQPWAAGLIAAPLDKAVHAGVIAVLTVLLAAGFALPLGAVAALSLLVGFADEWHQGFLPGRIASADDWLADLGGVALAVGANWVWRCRGFARMGRIGIREIGDGGVPDSACGCIRATVGA